MRVAVFDSGIGGVTVLNELTSQFPDTQFLYFGDTANVPYGSKSESQIRALVVSACARMREKKITSLVIACNTAASIAYDEFRAHLPGVSLFNVVEAGIQAILTSRIHRPAVIFGTKATIKSKIYSRLLSEENRNFEIHEIACPLLVPMIEEGWIDHPILKATVLEYTRPIQNLSPGVALLACTHYPWIQKQFEQVLPGWKVLNSAHAAAEILKDELQFQEGNKSNPPEKEIEWYFSDVHSVNTSLLGLSHVALRSF